MYVIATWVLSIGSVLGVGGTIAAFIFFPTVAVPVAEKVVQWLLGCAACLWIGLVIGSALGSYWYGRHGEYDKGHTAAIAAIAAEDEAALAHAVATRRVWQDCKARSGTWDQSTGECS